MTSAQKLARYGAAFALALTLVASAAPSFAFADEGDDSAPFVLNTVNGGIQTTAAATEFGLGIGEAASGEQGLGVGAAGTDVGAAVVGAGLGIPAGILSAHP